MHIDHIAIWTNDLEGMKEFYSRHFGCKVSERYENPRKQFSSYFLSFEMGARIEIMQRSDINAISDNVTIGLAHFALEVASRDMVDNLTGKFEQNGVIVSGYPRITGDGYYESVILDPDKNQIEIVAK